MSTQSTTSSVVFKLPERNNADNSYIAEDPGSLIPVSSTELDGTGIYKAADSSYRAFVSDSPRTPTVARPKTQVDLVLPPLAAFQEPDPCELPIPVN